MAFIPVPNGIKVAMRFSQAGQELVNVFYVTTVDTVDASWLLGLCAAIKSWWVANLQSGVTSTVGLQEITATDASVDGGTGVSYTSGLPLFGTDAGGPLPNNVTLAVKLMSGLTGRSHRGRKYLVGMPANKLTTDTNHVSSAYQTAIKSAYDLLISDLLVYGAQLVIASFTSGGVPRTTAEVSDVITTSVNATVDAMRRRLPERGI
jgi:hypothetical protein